MAIAVPLVMGAMGAATTTIVATSLVMAVTGISSKIDKAASKVFGKDLVKAANIGGAMFMAFGGGFGGAAEAATSGGEALSGMDMAADAAAGSGNSLSGAASALDATAGPSMAGSMQPQATQQVGIEGALKQASTKGSDLMSGLKDTASKAVDSVSKAWSGADPRTKSTLLQVGGSVLAGTMDAKSRQAEIEAQRAYESRYRSGSGLTSWAPGSGALAYYNRKPTVYTPPGRT